MRRLLAAISVSALIAMSSLAALAAPAGGAASPASAPAGASAAKPASEVKPAADAPAQDVVLKTTVMSVTGCAQKLAANGTNKWEELKVGDVLDEKTIVRTGFNSMVVLHLSDRGEYTINGATKMGISELRKQGNVVKSTVGIKYGSIHASIDSTKGANDFKISTPVATLSVRGSSGNIGFTMDSSSPAMHFAADTGHWMMNSTGGGSMEFTNGEHTNTNGRGIDSTFQSLVQSILNVSSIDLGAAPSERASAAILGTIGGSSGWSVAAVSTVAGPGSGSPPVPSRPAPTPPKPKVDFP